MSLSGKPKFLFARDAHGFGNALFRQDLKILEGAYPGRSRLNALDRLSGQLLMCPSMVMQFINFDKEIIRRFDSIIMETMESKPGAMPFSDVLELRDKCKRTFEFGSLYIRMLENEDVIKQLWK
jgi:hypothetical protein